MFDKRLDPEIGCEEEVVAEGRTFSSRNLTPYITLFPQLIQRCLLGLGCAILTLPEGL